MLFQEWTIWYIGNIWKKFRFRAYFPLNKTFNLRDGMHFLDKCKSVDFKKAAKEMAIALREAARAKSIAKTTDSTVFERFMKLIEDWNNKNVKIIIILNLLDQNMKIIQQASIGSWINLFQSNKYNDYLLKYILNMKILHYKSESFI